MEKEVDRKMSATNIFEAQANALFAVIGTMMPLF